MPNCCLRTLAAARLAVDPTGTLTIRRKYEAALVQRFRLLKRIIFETIVKLDVFSLAQPRILSAMAAPSPGAFTFPLSSEKSEAFMEWLNQQVEQGILEVWQGPKKVVFGDQRWQNLYVRSAYQKGIADARSAMKREGVAPPTSPIGAIFNSPFHADRLGLLFSRNFAELKGITDAMSQGISRELAQGLADGIGPRALAGKLNKAVDGIGIKRSRALARTEVIRAHAVANLNEYQEAGLDRVMVQAEVLTAGDDRVCPICADYAASTSAEPVSIDQARSLGGAGIPFHPNCRCCWLPIAVAPSRKKR